MRRHFAAFAAGLVVTILGADAASPAAAAEARRELPKAAYTLRELIQRSELILVGTVQGAQAEEAKADGAATGLVIKPGEVLKGKAPEGEVRAVCAGPSLPKGTSAIWFLTKGSGEAYVIDHPQCVYDVMHLARLRLALEKPGEIGLREYLREDDRRLARAIVERAEFGLDEERLAARPVSDGLQLSAAPVKSPLRRGDYLSVQFTLTNVGRNELAVTDSVFWSYHVRVRRLDEPGAKPQVLNQKDASVLKGTDLGIEGYSFEEDFIKLAPGEKLTRTIGFSPESFPVLKSPGRIEVAGVYRVVAPEEAQAFEHWSGTLVGETATVEIVER